MVSVNNINKSTSINTNQWKKDKWHAHNQTSFLLLYSKINIMYDVMIFSYNYFIQYFLYSKNFLNKW